jgi:hypothetical protein
MLGRRSQVHRLPPVALLLCWVLGCTNDYDGLVAGDSGTPGGGSPGSASSAAGASGGATGAQGGEGAGGVRSGAGGASGGTAAGGTGGSGGSGEGTVTYTAVVAACLDPGNPDPSTCEDQSGDGTMIVDTDFTDGGGGPRHIYLRFDLDGQLQGKNVVAAAVRLTVTETGASDSSGELWEVTGFTAASLEDTAPAYPGAAPLSPAQGPVDANELVELVLASTVKILPSAPAYFGIKPSSGDGTRYWNTEGQAPPTLVVDYGP